LNLHNFSSRINLERILDNLKEGIIAHDLNRRIVFFNQRAEQITGFSREEILGKDCHEAFGEPFCGDRCTFCEPIPQLEEKSEYSVVIKTKGGEMRRIDMYVTKISDENDDFFGVLASFQDVTDLVDTSLKGGECTRFGNIIGQDIKMLQVFLQIRNVAGYDYPVHVFGETGTGKELVAGAIHAESRRRCAPFVPINCGALPEELIESELFGHVRGAFSGAIKDKKGRFELADGGTVFLDEVAELSKPMQVKILRFLQEGTFEKVGGETTQSIEVRIISATNRDLKQEVKKGRFREDLYYRLNVIPLQLPPLRERKSDIPVLIDHFLHQAARKGHRKTIRFSSDAMPYMMAYPWPGNVRELENAVQYAIVKSSGLEITPKDLPFEIFDGSTGIKRRMKRSHKLNTEIVSAALKKAGNNKAKAARILGVGRATLYRFLNDHRLS
jgi:PAS domain S-box-containing protein